MCVFLLLFSLQFLFLYRIGGRQFAIKFDVSDVCNRQQSCATAVGSESNALDATALVSGNYSNTALDFFTDIC